MSITNTTIRSEFPQSEDIIYLNHAAVAPWPKRTAEAVTRFGQENVCFGAYHYSAWLRKEAELREQLRQLINAPSCDDIALVKNTSEALSFVAYGFPWKSGDNIVSSNEEFPSNRIPWQSLADRGVEYRQAALTDSEHPEESIFSVVDSRTRLISISSVQFASGLRINLEKIGEFCRQRNILFCVDAIQSIGALRFDVKAIGADFVMADGHKWMLGPEGLGVFYTRPRSRKMLKLTQFGWHMIDNAGDYANRSWYITSSAKRFECGSLNLLGVHALSASLSLLLETGLEHIEARILDNTAWLIETISATPSLQLLSSPIEHLRSGIVLFRHKRVASEKLYKYLLNQGIVCAQRSGGIRFSPHFYNARSQLEQALNRIDECPDQA